MFLRIVCCVVLLFAGFRQVSAQNSSRSIDPVQALVSYLDSTDYMHLFNLGAYTWADSLHDADTSMVALKEIVCNPKVSMRTRFFAAQVLFEGGWKPGDSLYTMLAGIYARALKENYTEMGNPWGLPDDTGDIGDNIMVLGDAIVVAFRPLLKCNTPVYYAGSRRAYTGRLMKYRVKDIAASYICAVRKTTFNGDRRRFGRSVQIAFLRIRLCFSRGSK